MSSAGREFQIGIRLRGKEDLRSSDLQAGERNLDKVFLVAEENISGRIDAIGFGEWEDL